MNIRLAASGALVLEEADDALRVAGEVRHDAVLGTVNRTRGRRVRILADDDHVHPHFAQ